MRSKDAAIIAAILSLFGMLWGPMKKIVVLDQTIVKVEKLEDKVAANTQSLAVTDSRYQDINKQLEQINWQLRRLTSSSSSRSYDR